MIKSNQIILKILKLSVVSKKLIQIYLTRSRACLFDRERSNDAE